MYRLLVLLFVLSACGSVAAAPTGQGVLDAFTAAGISVTNVRPNTLDPSSPVPRSFTENLAFEAPGLAPAGKGGQVFICDTKKNCDALYAYFDALKALAGPYLYQNPGGRVVVQLNSGMTPDAAAKFEKVVATIP